jgi:hypothetical protein
LSSIVCFEDRCEREEDLKRRELEERLKQHIEQRLQELLQRLTQEYEIEVSLDPSTLKGVGRWKRKH